MFDDKFFGNPEFNEEKVYKSRTAVIVGRVILEDDVIVGPQASIRADEGTPFKICKGTNVQDHVNMHGLHNKFVSVGGEKFSIYIDSHCSIAHGALIHGPVKIGKKTFIGFKAIVHCSEIGRNCYIGHGAIIEGVKIADNRYVRSGTVVDCQTIADALPPVPDHLREFNREVVDYNKQLREQYHERRKDRLNQEN